MTSEYSEQGRPITRMAAYPVDFGGVTDSRNEDLLAELTAAETLLWTRCSVFADGFDAETAHSVCSGDGLTVTASLLGSLVHKSILTVEHHDAGSSRYALPESLRQDGRTELRAAGELTRLRRRHRDHYLALADSARRRMFGAEHLDWLVRLRQEHPNFRLALEYCRDRDPLSGLQLAADLRFHWVTSSQLDEGRDWLARLLTLSPQPSPARADALWVASWLALTKGDRSTATALLDEGQTVADKVGSQSAQGFVALFSGQVAMSGGDHAGAAHCYERALIHLRAIDDRDGLVIALNRLALAYARLDRPEDAMVAAGESHEICVAGDDAPHNSYALWVLGILAWQRGDIGDAARLHRESLLIRRSMRDLPGQALSLAALSWLASTEGRHELAATLIGFCRTLRGLVVAQLASWGDLTRYHDQAQTRTRQWLGDEAYLAAVANGAGLTLEQAGSAALDDHRVAAAPIRPDTLLAEIIVHNTAAPAGTAHGHRR
jgi:tetratricopeptide (TPR) repeat protein